jgi:catechol 2,3-dioxygenase-like lactoylglutathione lyase family enzyme
MTGTLMDHALPREGAMAVKGIDHWVIVAGDLERTLAFYQRLGLTIVWEPRPARPGRGMPTIRINEAQKINVHAPDWPDRPGYLGARRPSVGGADFCLEWEGTVEQVLDLLARHGIAIEAGPGPRTCARGGSTSVYVRDPDDNLVEFTVYGG